MGLIELLTFEGIRGLSGAGGVGLDAAGSLLKAGAFEAWRILQHEPPGQISLTLTKLQCGERAERMAEQYIYLICEI